MTHIEEALAELQRVLEPHADTRDWSLPAGPPEQPMEWSCWDTAAHIAHDLAAYAGQLAALPEDVYLPFDLVVRPGTAPREVLRVIRAAGGMLTSALATSTPDARAFHWGPCDPTGFEAMGVAETVLHTYDITQGLGVPWTPPARSATLVLERLFPDAPSAPASDPAEVLLWCTGRGELPGHKRLTSWVWQAAREG
ncbi:hypothetical protein ACIO3O_05230 [Streptomyces sp. NPDC087440]|uniref:hypothetical protein n=1 Tax=Streptomyces sp. NPDC087440 TaxID=3365790 RepID=UPI00380206C1